MQSLLLAVEGGPVGSLCAGRLIRWPPRVRARRDFKEGSELAACNTLVRSLLESLAVSAAAHDNCDVVGHGRHTLRLGQRQRGG